MSTWPAFWWVALWGLAVLASWVGWGSLAAAVVRARRGVRLDWGLRAGWGMAISLALGGLLIAFHLGDATVIQIGVLAGAGIWVAELFSHYRQAKNRTRLLPGIRTRGPWHLPLFALATLAYFGSIGSIALEDLNWSDDLPAYLVLVKRILQTGALIDPFGLRRLATYGGQQFLQAQILSVGSESHAFIIDKGLSLIVLLALLAGMFPRRGRRHAILLLLVGLLAALFDVPRVNTTSQMSSVVLLLTLLRTLRLCRPGDRRGAWLVPMLGVIGAGLASFRMNLLPVGALLLLVAFAARALRDRRRWRTYTGRAGAALGVMVLVLIPWAVALWQSSQTFFYPLMRGNQRPEYDGIYSSPMSLPDKTAWVLGFVSFWKVALLLAPVLLTLRRRAWAGPLALYVATLAGAIALALTFKTTGYWTLYRYAFPMLLAAALAALVFSLHRWRTWSFCAAVAWTVLLIGLSLRPAWRTYLQYANRINLFITDEPAFVAPELALLYRTAQETIPPGEKIYAMVSIPTLLDFSRNEILTADEAGLAAPSPGIPVFDGPEKVRAYFLSQNIHYLMIVDFNIARGLYSRPTYQQLWHSPETTGMQNTIESRLARALVTMEDNLDALAIAERTRVIGPLRVIRLN